MHDHTPHSLYVHVPFCVSKCPYCDFNSHVALDHLFAAYNRALCAELRAWAEELDHPRLDTVFIGGGTPSLVPAEHIAGALDAVRAAFNLSPDAEVTLEANPHSAEAKRMDAWLAAGVNRLSLGFQSLDEDALAFLERAHSAGEAVDVFQRARKAGFDNINCDLIFALPGLSTSRWKEVLDAVIRLRPEHISAYELTPEAGTRLGADVKSGRTVMPDDDLKLAQYDAAAEALGRGGYQRYEVSNWALPGRECRHNIAYWSGVPYAAAGAGAHAYLHRGCHPAWLGADVPPDAVAVRQWNLSNPAAYIQAVKDHGHASAGHEWLDLRTTLGELMMMGLRRDAGVDLALTSNRFGTDVLKILARPLQRGVDDHLLRLEGTVVTCTERGGRLLNRVAAEFIA
jgi:oxygen-independent coproporphyrinogen-3 oxidase